MNRRCSSEAGFSRIDLCALLLVASCLLALAPRLFSDLAGQTKSAVCMANHQQLINGWLMYAEANGGRLVENVHGGPAQGGTAIGQYSPWAIGWLTWDLRADNTNTLFLTDSRYARLGPFINANPKVFKCPADSFVSSSQRTLGWEYRVRSYSMNLFMGDGNSKDFFGSLQTIYLTLDKISLPAPAKAYVFLEEHPDSINDPAFIVDPGSARLVDVPAGHHNAANVFSFADGHVELHRWVNRGGWVKPVTGGIFSPPALSLADPDWNWLRERATARAPR